MDKVDKNNEFVRQAIWEVYNKRCFYTGKPLDYIDMQLDHIIPESYTRKENELERIIKDCQLDDEFEINSLFNLVPTNRYENRRKSDKEHEINAILHYLNLVKSNVPKVQNRIEKLKKSLDFDKNISMVKAFVNDENDSEKREQLLESIISFVTNENNNFENIEEIYEHDNEQIFKKYTDRIGLEAIMPRYNNPETRCIFYFRTLKVRDCMVILDNKVILSELFSGIHTDPKHGVRSFIIFENKSKDNEGKYDLENAFIHIGNNKLRLSSDDINKFCQVIDAYADKYIEFINKIENILMTHRYPLSKRKNNYRLLKVTNDQWKQLVDFGFKHDVDEGNSEWHIFDKNRYFIKIYTNKQLSRYDIGYHAFFNGEHDEDVVFYPEFSSNNIYITWELVEDLRNKKIECISRTKSWDAETAYKWLVEELIPKVFGHNINFLKSRNSEIDEFLRNSNFEYIIYLEDREVYTLEELKEVVSHLQNFFHYHPNHKYRTKKIDFDGIYNSILLCLNRAVKVDLHYLCEKLCLNKCNTIMELIKTIETDIMKTKDRTVHGFDIDYLFRAFIATLEGKKVYLTTDEIRIIMKNIEYFILINDREILLEKYAVNFI